MKSNLSHWQRMQDYNYFENHPCYLGLNTFDHDRDLSFIEPFRKLEPTDKVAIIGCGYGRETRLIAPKVAKVYGIDVSPKILDKARNWLAGHGVHNFTPVLAASYRDEIPNDLDLVYSIVCFQHLTRDLVADYFENMVPKLKSGGSIIAQFYEDKRNPTLDAPLESFESVVTWTADEVRALAASVGLKVEGFVTSRIPDYESVWWHWLHGRKP